MLSGVLINQLNTEATANFKVSLNRGAKSLNVSTNPYDSYEQFHLSLNSTETLKFLEDLASALGYTVNELPEATAGMVKNTGELEITQSGVTKRYSANLEEWTRHMETAEHLMEEGAKMKAQAQEAIRFIEKEEAKMSRRDEILKSAGYEGVSYRDAPLPLKNLVDTIYEKGLY